MARQAKNLNYELTGQIWREGETYVACCTELDIASEGATVEAAKANLTEAVNLFLECASDAEIERKLPPKPDLYWFPLMAHRSRERACAVG